MSDDLVVRLDDESVEWLIEAARHHSPEGMGHVADELWRALWSRSKAKKIEYYGPVPASRLVDEMPQVLTAMEQDRPILVSHRGRVFAAMGPVVPEDLVPSPAEVERRTQLTERFLAENPDATADELIAFEERLDEEAEAE